MEALSMVLPPRPLSAEVIDVDALEDEDMDEIVMTGFSRMSQSSSAPRSSSMSQSLASEGVVYMGFRQPTIGRRSGGSGAQAHASTSTRSREQDVIVLSDDEDAPSSSSASHRASRRLVSPPPPPPQRGFTPAVPPLPSYLSSQNPSPRRQRRAAPTPSVTPSVTPPVIRPSEHPLPFEIRMTSRRRLPPRRSSPALAAAPRSHHQPAMGFGGALISLNRQRSLEEANRQERETRTSFNLPTFTDIFRRLSSYRGNSSTPSSNVLGVGHGRWPWSWLMDEQLLENPDPFPPFIDDVWYPLPEMRGTEKKVVHYKPEYTHPDEAAPGYTFDFAPAEPASSHVIDLEDEAGPSNAASSSSSVAAVETTLVCARCLDPLLLAAPEGTSEEERKKYRVWALRCGHMLDGKCIAELLTPPPPVPVDSPAEEYVGKGKGKARADPDNVPVQADGPDVQPANDLTPPSSDRKGKRKAVQALESEPSLKRVAVAAPAPEDGSIRSRLRSRARAIPEVSPPALEEDPAMHATGPLAGRSRRRLRLAGGFGTGRTLPEESSFMAGIDLPAPSRGRAKGKGKGRAKAAPKPAVEAEHEWRCPIGACGRVHYSVRLRGESEWKNDDGRGPIALFV